MPNVNRRNFIQTLTLAGATFVLSGSVSPIYAREPQKGKRIGLIGLDNSQSIAFAKSLNATNADAAYAGYKIVAAYPNGSLSIKSSAIRIPEYTAEVKKLGVEIVNSIEQLLLKVDVVILETNDGRLHLEQALPVLKAGKKLFINKPLAASLADAIAIYKAADQYHTPVFSSSSVRYIDGIDAVQNGKLGKITGAETYSPATLEPSHPDLFWYGVHGVELLFAIMGTGCKSVVEVSNASTDVVVGTWTDGRVGTFRGIRTGKKGYGATVFAEREILVLNNYIGHDPLLKRLIQFFETGKVPVSPQETLEIYAFMEAAAESKKNEGKPVNLKDIK